MNKKPIKVFISQPMNNRTEEDIFKERDEIVKKLKSVYDNITVIVGWTTDNLSPIESIGKSIMMLNDVDLVVFADNWKLSRRCRIEYQVCIEYGITVFTNLNDIKYLSKVFKLI